MYILAEYIYNFNRRMPLKYFLEIWLLILTVAAYREIPLSMLNIHLRVYGICAVNFSFC
jgi:hypothetical protein